MARHYSHSSALSRALLIFGVLLLGLAGSGCERVEAPALAETTAGAESPAAASDDPLHQVDDAVTPMSGEWRLIAIDRTELSQGDAPTVVFGDEGWCWGHTGVNDYRMTFTLEGLKYNRLNVGNAAVTRKAGPPEAMALERLFLERLESAASYELSGDMLYLHSGENQNLTFERVYQ
jgi:heat shock protein HslJ